MPVAIPFVKELQVRYGALERVAQNVRRLVANNPGPFTHLGTGTYVVGDGSVAVIDPGPLLPEHVDALLRELAGEEITHIFVTHTHLDHSPSARLLAQRTGARCYGFGPHAQGPHQRGEQVEAGADLEFAPDVRVSDGEVIACGGVDIECVHTPGHAHNHVCFGVRGQRALFTGDHVMGWSTTVVSPPDGDMGDYMRSLGKLLRRGDARLFPAHGAPVGDPARLVTALLQHRREREQQILSLLAAGSTRIDELVPVMYREVPSLLHPAAARSVLAHLVDLCERGRVECEGPQDLGSHYQLRSGD